MDNDNELIEAWMKVWKRAAEQEKKPLTEYLFEQEEESVAALWHVAFLVDRHADKKDLASKKLLQEYMDASIDIELAYYVLYVYFIQNGNMPPKMQRSVAKIGGLDISKGLKELRKRDKVFKMLTERVEIYKKDFLKELREQFKEVAFDEAEVISKPDALDGFTRAELDHFKIVYQNEIRRLEAEAVIKKTSKGFFSLVLDKVNSKALYRKRSVLGLIEAKLKNFRNEPIEQKIKKYEDELKKIENNPILTNDARQMQKILIQEKLFELHKERIKSL